MSHHSHSPHSPPLSPVSRPLSLPSLFGPVPTTPSPPSVFRSPLPGISPKSSRRRGAKVQFAEPDPSLTPSPTFPPVIPRIQTPPLVDLVDPPFEEPYIPQLPPTPYSPVYDVTEYPPSPPSPPIPVKNKHVRYPIIHPTQSQPRPRHIPSARPSSRQLERWNYQSQSPYPTPPYQSVHHLPTPPQSQRTLQQPTPPYQGHSVYQQPTPYQGYPMYQQPTPYHNIHQQPTPPQQNPPIYQPPTSHWNYPVYRQPTPPLLPVPEQGSTVHGSNYLLPSLDQSPGMSSEAPDAFSDKAPSNKFMEKLLQHTIIGAEFDSSDRYPPPRCHPRTRLGIIERCKSFVVRCDGKEKLRWIIGSAGIGKSAVMQTVAEETPADVTLGASVFFTEGKRQDGTKMFTTIAYQFAAKSQPYRQFIRNEITKDPSLLRKSLPVQFNQFIIEPFIHQRLFDPSSRLLVIIDGLDQCDDPLIQRDLLGLISYFCMTYPTSPVVWIIASRPEPHITSFFDDARFAPAYSKEEMVVDSDEAREDVRRYLHAELKSIQLAYPSLKRKRQWPSELEFNKIATAAGGLFAYASTVVRYIGDPRYRGPGSRISKVLIAIDADPGDDLLERDYPLGQLDDLYDKILSKIPDDTLVDTRMLLLLRLGNTGPFRLQCNLLGLTEDAAYTAMDHIHSLMRVPGPSNADDGFLQFFHKSFEVYLRNFKRSRFSRDVQVDAQKLLAQCSMRIIDEVSNGVANGEEMNYDGISLSWPGDDLFETSDSELRLKLYQHAIATISPTVISSTILSRVPNDHMIIARKLLLLRLYSNWGSESFRIQCNLLGLTAEAAYDAIRHGFSVIRAPEPEKADEEPLTLFHKSLEDHLRNCERPGSGFSTDIRAETEELVARASLRIVGEVEVDPDGMGGDEVLKYENVGYLKGGRGVSDNVSLSWRGGDHPKITDDELRLKLYSGATANILFGFRANVEAFVNMPCFKVLTTRFAVLGIDFPFCQVRDFAFDKCRRELSQRGLLKQVPLQALDFAAICGPISLHLSSSTNIESSSRWNSACTHEKKVTGQGWSTSFGRYEEDDWSEVDDGPSSKEHDRVIESNSTEMPQFKIHTGNEYHWSFLGEECLWTMKQCNHCLRRLACCFVDNPDQLVTVFVDSTELCYGELLFVDTDDGGSQWRYRFFHSGSPKV